MYTTTDIIILVAIVALFVWGALDIAYKGYQEYRFEKACAATRKVRLEREAQKAHAAYMDATYGVLPY